MVTSLIVVLESSFVIGPEIVGALFIDLAKYKRELP